MPVYEAKEAKPRRSSPLLPIAQYFPSGLCSYAAEQRTSHWESNKKINKETICIGPNSLSITGRSVQSSKTFITAVSVFRMGLMFGDDRLTNSS